MRLLIARAIVVICGCGLRDYRSLRGKYGSLLWRDGCGIGDVACILIDRHKKGPNVVSVRACEDAWCGGYGVSLR